MAARRRVRRGPRFGPQPGRRTRGALTDALAAYAADHSPSTVRRVLSTWRGFARWLRREGWLSADSTEEIEGPARPDWEAQTARDGGAWATCGGRHHHGHPSAFPLASAGSRSPAVFVGARVRVGEAMAMRVSDIEARDRSPRLGVYGKFGRWRVVPVGPEGVEAVDDYLLSRSERFGPHSPTDVLFVRSDGRPFSRGTSTTSSPTCVSPTPSSSTRAASTKTPSDASVRLARHRITTLDPHAARGRTLAPTVAATRSGTARIGRPTPTPDPAVAFQRHRPEARPGLRSIPASSRRSLR